jgi:hypothetical protein
MDGFVAAQGTVLDLCKIDVEGAELLVLRDIRTTLATVRPLILVEVTETEEAVCALLEDAGCRPFEATPRPRGPGRLTATRFALHGERPKDATSSLLSAEAA